MWLWFVLACDSGAAQSVVDWQIPPADLGNARVDGTGFAADDGEGLGAAFPEVMPGWNEDTPAWSVPSAIWAIAMDNLVADEGACPYVELEGADQHFRSDCRSQDGYEWSGTVTQQEWTEGDLSFTRYDFDVDVVADVDSPRFTSLALHGGLQRASDGDKLEHVDVNLAAELLGYYEARGVPDDVHVPTRADWNVSGSVERDGEAFGIDLAADVGGTKGFLLRSAELSAAASCPVEPSGTADMGSGVTATFEGADGCDACATITDGGDDVGACAPS